MSSGTHYYSFKSDLELRNYLGEDIPRMVFALENHKIIIEEQFEKLDSYIIKDYGEELRKVLQEITGEEIIYDYSVQSALYFLYENNNMTREEAFDIVEQWNKIYFKNIY